MIAIFDHLAIVAVMVSMLTTGCTNVVNEPQFKITTKRDNDKVVVQIENGKAVFSIHSPFGISQAIIERLDETWSDAVVLRLHLKGLGHFKVTNGKVTIEAAASIDDFRIWKDGDEASPLDSKSPYWMEIRAVGNDGKPAKFDPLEDGYFEMQLPKTFFEGNPKSITINWIDFYRN